MARGRLEDPFADHPYGDGPLLAGTRFAVELAAWVFGPWAALRRWDLVAAVIIGLALIGIPAVFSVEGDKHQVVVAVPGWVRLLIEVALYGIAAVAALEVLGDPAGPAVAIAVSVAAIVQAPRWNRLARGPSR